MTPDPLRQAAVQQLSAVPGVIGSLVFGAGGEVEASAFPPSYDAGALSRLASQLAADAYFQEWMAGDQALLTLRFPDGQVAVRSLGCAWVVVLCRAQANEQLLSMSLTQLQHRLKASAPPAPPAAPPPPAAPEPPPPGPLDRLRELAQAELGAHASEALRILAEAGPRPRDLVRAVAEVEKLVRLFISKKKADEIGRRMREVLGT